MVFFLIFRSIFRIRKHNISLILSIIGIAIGIFSIISISGIMNGMQSLLIEKLVLVETYDYRGSITINNNDNLEYIKKEILNIEGVSYATAFIEQFAVLEHAGRSNIVTIRAIDFNSFLKDKELFAEMKLLHNKYPQYAYEELSSTLIGYDISKRLIIQRDDKVNIILPGEKIGFIPVQFDVLISDIFSITQKYNSNWVFIPLQYYLSQDIQLPITVNFGIRAKKNNTVRSNLETVLSNISTWEENHNSFYIALKTEKIMLFLMLVAIFCVVILHFRFSMLRRINRKREEIVALRTIGSNPEHIQKWFIGETIIIGVLGCIIGILLSSLFLYYFSYISQWLANVFNLYIDVDTSTIVVASIIDIVYIAFFTIFLLFLTSVSIVKSVNKISPAQIIRYE